jgi:hypothetical protein
MATGCLEPAGNYYIAEPGLKMQYQSAVGTFMYAMLGTRPDIAFTVSLVSRHAANPTSAHMAAVKRIFQYLKCTITYSSPSVENSQT